MPSHFDITTSKVTNSLYLYFVFEEEFPKAQIEITPAPIALQKLLGFFLLRFHISNVFYNFKCSIQLCYLTQKGMTDYICP